MIKEYIDELPGGKEFITAQRGIGVAIGATTMFMISVLFGWTLHGKMGAMYSRDSAIIILLVISGFLWTSLLGVSIITYLIRINRADNIYMKNSRQTVQESKLR